MATNDWGLESPSKILLKARMYLCNIPKSRRNSLGVSKFQSGIEQNKEPKRTGHQEHQKELHSKQLYTPYTSSFLGREFNQEAGFSWHKVERNRLSQSVKLALKRDGVTSGCNPSNTCCTVTFLKDIHNTWVLISIPQTTGSLKTFFFSEMFFLDV